METETVYVFETLSGIAVDRFTSENSTSRQSIVYSTIAYNSATFYRQYLYGETYYEYLFNGTYLPLSIINTFILRTYINGHGDLRVDEGGEKR